MEYFHYLMDSAKETLFYKVPKQISKYDEKELLAHSLGATLYMPATRRDIADLILNAKYHDLTSLVICLEDAVGDHELAYAEENCIQQLTILYRTIQRRNDLQNLLPLIFIRVRSSKQLIDVFQRLGEAVHLLTGAVFPKFSADNAEEFLQSMDYIRKEKNCLLYGMPILETPDILYKETRIDRLWTLHALLADWKDHILNIRIGAADLCGLFGIRRTMNTTIYDVAILQDFIADVVNIFGRREDGCVISGPVWEYFDSGERILKPQLRQSPFQKGYGEHGLEMRKNLLTKHIDGLIQEVLLDKINGLTGKTVIHPTHLAPVHALHVVTKEEYSDALAITENAGGEMGVLKSHYHNKMNEIKPHYYWAEKILLKSHIYGVFHEGYTYIDILNEPAYV
ncbi:HpcH/HpaI aldolase/citrate lyase family protein [Bacillus taeanensis]|uniref:Citrate lyase subunit beta n=1 Tax=Bacillus taeanensis TaxID=273032 RepID=A0A366XX68_9BACI|nr:HpcH/HpaI aldolase/citrate lyase family protein [Bacillus taeanensis]RBW70990.1 citrate lyase subunit beta [Bacillus taeanensis]